MSGGQELEAPGVPALFFDKHSPLDEKYISSVHSIAETTVHDVVQEAVEDLTRAVADATQWLADAVRGELLSQSVASAEPIEEGQTELSFTEPPESVESLQAQSETLPLTLSLTQPSSAVVHAVAKATVEAVTVEALKNIVQAVEKATEWFSQAVENELVSKSVAPDESVVLDNATEWSTESDDNAPIVHAVTGASIVFIDPDITEIPEAVDAPQLSLQASEISVSHLHELAKATTEEVVRRALDDVTKAIGDASQRFTQDVSGELLAKAVAEATPEENSPSLIADIDPPAPVPALQLPHSAPSSPEQAAECHELAVPFVNDVVSTALQQVKPANPLESEEYANEEYEEYTPINSPAASSRSPLPSSRSAEQETQPEIQANVASGRATPPDTKATPRKKSPITSKRGLGTPRLKEKAPSSAPPLLPSPRTDEPPTEPAPSILPPLVLPVVQSTAKTKRLKTPRKTPRVASSNDEEVYAMDSSRSSSSRLNKHSSRVPIATAELELTPKSSARAAALIYAQQPPSSRHHQHHHHKPKKLRDYATQTSPPPSPPLPRQFLPGVQDESNSNEQPKPQSKHSPRDTPSLESSVVKKPESSSNTLLAPLSKTPVISPSTDSSTKASSPSRSHKSHGHKPSPNKRSGYCQRCTFEGRSCKINDCLKHQALK